jgi:hypothetical protein
MGTPALQPADVLVLQTVAASPGLTLFGAMKLQKLLFIAHHPREFGLTAKRPLHAFPFKVYKNGPFSDAIYASTARLREAGLLEEETRDTRRLSQSPVSPTSEDEGGPPLQVRVYTADPAFEEELPGADAYDLRVVREAVEKWGWLTGEQLEQLVLMRTGLTPDLKEQYMGVEWERFVKQAEGDLVPLPPPPPDFWRAQQQFLKERPSLIPQLGKGKFVAYLRDKRVGAGDDEITLYKRVRESQGRPPDFIGFLSETGRPLVDALDGG